MRTDKNIIRSHHHSTQSRKTRLNRVIHVTIRNSHVGNNKSSSLTTSHPRSMQVSSVSRNLSEHFKNSALSSNAPINSQQSHLSSQVTKTSIHRSSKETLTISQMKDAQLDQKDCTYDHHRNKKKKCLRLDSNGRRYICLGIILLIVTIIVISITLPILFTKHSSKKYFNRSAVLRWNSSGITVASSLVSPYGFKVDRFDTLYIAEYNAHRIRRWLSGASNGTIIAGSVNGTNGSASNQFYCPVDVLVEDNGDMYVTDRGNGRLQFWANGSSSGITVAGTGSNNSVHLSFPSGIVQDSSSKEIYIADYGYSAVVSYPSGSVVAGGHGKGYTNEQLYDPIGLSHDAFSKSLIIAAYNAHNIVQWTLGVSNWTLIAGGLNGTYGNTSTLLFHPLGVTIDPMGNVYVADSGNCRIQLFLRDQSEGVTIAGVTGVFGTNPTLLIVPYWAQLDNQLNLYVADTGKGRIQKFFRY